jgi:hypothetical protein
LHRNTSIEDLKFYRKIRAKNSTKRVEINSVTEALNDNQKFWDWIVFKLRANFTDWDYTRAVEIPQYVRPRPFNH